MKINTHKPTDEFYGRLQQAYDYFNEKLFENTLPHCLITVQREKNTMGFFSPMRWSNEGASDVHEIALNPAYFANRRLIEIFQTMVHEQCHAWQHEFGTPSRVGYHNMEWAEKMQAIGLMPSTTGAPGGNKVGQKMSDYVIEDGRFKKTCLELLASGFQFKWLDRRAAMGEILESAENMEDEDFSLQLPAPVSAVSSIAAMSAEVMLNTSMSALIPNFQHQYALAPWQTAKIKTKYSCPGCAANVWGKPHLHLRCEDCDMLFQTE